jgi:hypothetical protein
MAKKKYKEYMGWGTGTSTYKFYFEVPEGKEEEFKKDPMKYNTGCRPFSVDDTELDKDPEMELVREFEEEE